MGGALPIGQVVQKQLGQTGIPVYNVSNACATGATALRVAVMAIKAGEADMGLAFGVEKLSGAGLLAGGTRKDNLIAPTLLENVKPSMMSICGSAICLTTRSLKIRSTRSSYFLI